jgi:MFS family permease
MLMRARFAEDRAKEHEHPPIVESMKETVRYARTHPRVLALLCVKGGYGAGAGIIALLSVYGKEVFRAGAIGIGLLFAARGLGALFGPFLMRFAAKSDEARYRGIAFAVLIFGAGYTGLALSPTLYHGLFWIFVAHLGGGAAWQVSTYGLQRESGDWIRGRVFSADYGFMTLTMAISSVVAGALSDRIGATPATIILSSLCVLWAVGWSLWTWNLWGRVKSMPTMRG